MKKQKLSHMTHVALATGLICVLSQIAFPLPTGVPITLQIFVIAFLGYILSPKQAICSVLLYLLLGASGVPVFANLKAGLPHLINLTGGFLWGMLPLVLFCSLGEKLANNCVRLQPAYRLIFGLLGLCSCHIFGILQYAFVAKQSFYASFLLVSAPYLIKDVIFIVMASILAKPAKMLLIKAHVI